jgi:hypothetical protein
MQSEADFLTVDEAALLTGFSHWTIRRWVGTKLTRFESMSRVLVSRTELLELVKPQRIEQRTRSQDARI